MSFSAAPTASSRNCPWRRVGKPCICNKHRKPFGDIVRARLKGYKKQEVRLAGAYQKWKSWCSPKRRISPLTPGEAFELRSHKKDCETAKRSLQKLRQYKKCEADAVSDRRKTALLAKEDREDEKQHQQDCLSAMLDN